ncbi:MAG: OadG family protein [Oscillospiraceae bacterium]|nr:OadG family protein [Oscillospiraceae bacterium]
MKISMGATLGYSLVGILVVFVVLAFLMLVIYLMELAFRKKNQQPLPQKSTVDIPIQAIELTKAKGSCGEVCRYDVPDATAAMLMAIVAEKMDAPLNELRFISIREVEDQEK